MRLSAGDGVDHCEDRRENVSDDNHNDCLPVCHALKQITELSALSFSIIAGRRAATIMTDCRH